MLEDQLTLPSEEWRDIKGFEGKYQVSNLGRVKSLKRIVREKYLGKDRQRMRRERILRAAVQKDKTLVILQSDGIKKTVSVHKLVLEAFIGPCPEGMEACHFPDKNVENNHIDNLRWDTHIANMGDKEIHGTVSRGESQGLAKLTENQVVAARKKYHDGRKCSEIADELGMSFSATRQMLTGLTWKHIPVECG